jgi:pimeloyl-ACP methyl ester carboxylesterase
MQESDYCRRGWVAGRVVVVALLLGGCCTTPVARSARCPVPSERTADAASESQLAFPDRLDRGYTIVLPGIWGAQPVDYGIVRGLQDGDVQSAVELYDWTAGVLRLVYNLRAIDHNKREAQKIAAKIVAYQDRYPGRPVHLVGYSGGAGVAVLALEALPPDRSVTDTVLLAPTLASDYDLRPAISHTKRGIHNFYSWLDVPILMVLSTAFGTTEGRHTVAAGAVGFQTPKQLEPEARDEYQSQVSQQSYSTAMLMDGHCGGHFGWSSRTFIARHVAPLLAVPDAQKESERRVAQLVLPSDMSPDCHSRAIVK